MAPKKGKTGGKKGKKTKNSNDDVEITRELVYKDIEQFQEYAQVQRLLGNCRCEVQCFDGLTRLGNIRGNMRKKVWIKAGDLVLVSLREYENNKCDIIYLYKPKEVRMLKSYGEIPDSVKVNETSDLADKNEEVDIGVDFKEEGEVSEEDEEKDKEEFKNNFDENFDNI